ncbi:unnamed protein product [Cochlearia groenlandica]
MELDDGRIHIPGPISRLYCRQSYSYSQRPRNPNNSRLRLIVMMSIVEEGPGSRRDSLRSHVRLHVPTTHPLIGDDQRQVMSRFLTSSGISNQDAEFVITSISCFGYETLALEYRPSWRNLKFHMNIVVGVDHYNLNIRRGIKIDQERRRTIKADSYDGVWDPDSIVVDNEEGFEDSLFFHIDEDGNGLKYTFGDFIEHHSLHFLSEYWRIPRIEYRRVPVPAPEPAPAPTRVESDACFKRAPTSESVVKRLKKSWLDEKTDCSICLSVMKVGAEATTLPCKHHFHNICIVNWLKTSHCCPMCRFALPYDKS